MPTVTQKDRFTSFIAIVIGAITFFHTVPAMANTPKIEIVTELFDRFQFIDHNDKLTGYSVEVVERLLALTGENPDIAIYPWSVAYQKALNKPNVMIFSIARNIEREVEFHWIGRLHHEPIYFWSLKSLHIPPVQSLNAIKEFTVAVVKEANSHRYLIKNGFSNIYLMTSTFSNIDTRSRLNMLNGERAHMVIASEHDVLNSIKNLGLDRAEISQIFHDPVLDNDLYIAFSRTTETEIVTIYQQAFQRLVDTGVLTQLRQKWHLN